MAKIVSSQYAEMSVADICDDDICGDGLDFLRGLLRMSSISLRGQLLPDSPFLVWESPLPPDKTSIDLRGLSIDHEMTLCRPE